MSLTRPAQLVLIGCPPGAGLLASHSSVAPGAGSREGMPPLATPLTPMKLPPSSSRVPSGDSSIANVFGVYVVTVHGNGGLGGQVVSGRWMNVGANAVFTAPVAAETEAR